MGDGMDIGMWPSVEACVSQEPVAEDWILRQALRDSKAAGLPDTHVTPLQGKFLQLLAKLKGASRVLEIGTLGGYSTIWLARALPPGGKLVTLELEPKRALIAARNIERAQLTGLVEVRLGRAAETLRSMIQNDEPPFEIIFIDADKSNNVRYLELAVQLSNPGTVIVCDNLAHKEPSADERATDADVQGIQEFNEFVSDHPRLIATAKQAADDKSSDIFSVVVVGE